jgi:LmbE family N-acetylglucosaminyl deacetylase
LVRVSFEVCSEGGAFEVLVRAGSIRRAEELAAARFPGGVVCVLFPIDGEEFFSDAEEVEGIEAVLPEAAAG